MRRGRAVALGLGSILALGTLVQIGREVNAYRRSLARLKDEWTRIPSPVTGASLRCRVRLGGTGAKTAAVLLHGYGIGTTYLVPLAARLASEMRVYAPDLPGHGLSEHDERPLTIPELADALAGWMDISELRSVVLVGHSMGCQIAAEVAAARPDLVSGLVLVGPTTDAYARTLPQQVLRLIACAFFERPSYVIWASLDYRRAGIALLVREMHELVTHRIEDVLPRIQVPALVARGSRDWIVSQRWAEEVARLVRAPSPLVVPGWAHAVQFDQPATIAALAQSLAP